MSRRDKLTDVLLKNAMLELLDKNDIAQITVTKLCEKADIHRTTFYLRYETLDAFYYKIAEEYYEELISETLTEMEKNKNNRRLFDTSGYAFLHQAQRKH